MSFLGAQNFYGIDVLPFAVEIAKAYGTHVTALCSTENVELAGLLGADRVFEKPFPKLSRSSVEPKDFFKRRRAAVGGAGRDAGGAGRAAGAEAQHLQRGGEAEQAGADEGGGPGQ